MPDIVAIDITGEQYEELTSLNLWDRRDWDAVFSTNQWGHIWSFSTYGPTPVENRVQIRGHLGLLDGIADGRRKVKRAGGRFFISRSGAYWKDRSCREFQFVSFRFVAHR